MAELSVLCGTLVAMSALWRSLSIGASRLTVVKEAVAKLTSKPGTPAIMALLTHASQGRGTFFPERVFRRCGINSVRGFVWAHLRCTRGGARCDKHRAFRIEFPLAAATGRTIPDSKGYGVNGERIGE